MNESKIFKLKKQNIIMFTDSPGSSTGNSINWRKLQDILNGNVKEKPSYSLNTLNKDIDNQIEDAKPYIKYDGFVEPKKKCVKKIDLNTS